MSAQLAIAQPHRIKATHRRRRKVAAGPIVQRYYDPQIGGFLSVDPAAVNTNTAANFCRYCYASNNPCKFTDPDGRFSWDMFANAFKVEVSAGAQIGVSGKFMNAAEGSIGIGGAQLGVGATGNDVYSFAEARGASAGVKLGNKLQIGKLPTVGRTEVGRHDVPQTDTYQKGSTAFGTNSGGSPRDTDSSGSVIGASIGAVIKVSVSVDLGQAAYALFKATPGEKPADKVNAESAWKKWDTSQ